MASPRIPFFAGCGDISIPHPQNPGRQITITVETQLAEAIGVELLGFPTVADFYAWLESPAVAPFWENFSHNYLSPSPRHAGHLHDARMEWDDVDAFWRSLPTEYDQHFYFAAAVDGRDIDQTTWATHQHYARFIASVVNHRGVVDRNTDVWPNFEQAEGAGFWSPGRHAWWVLGFLIAREQLRDNAATASEEDSYTRSHHQYQEPPRTPNRAPFDSDESDAETPPFHQPRNYEQLRFRVQNDISVIRAVHGIAAPPAPAQLAHDNFDPDPLLPLPNLEDIQYEDDDAYANLDQYQVPVFNENIDYGAYEDPAQYQVPMAGANVAPEADMIGPLDDEQEDQAGPSGTQ